MNHFVGQVKVAKIKPPTTTTLAQYLLLLTDSGEKQPNFYGVPIIKKKKKTETFSLSLSRSVCLCNHFLKAFPLPFASPKLQNQRLGGIRCM
jgi:hypothetical protein